MIKQFFSDKTILFYVEIAVAVLAIIAGIVYSITFAGTEYFSLFAVVLLFLSAVAFIALSIFGFVKIGAILMMVLQFSALLLSLLATYNYFVGFAINGGVVAALGDAKALSFVISTVLVVVCWITSNVMCWLKLTTSNKTIG